MQAMRNSTRCGMAGLVIGILGAATASAEPIAWTGGAGNGSWHTPGNWDLNRVPIDTDDVTISLDGTYTVSISSIVAARTLVLGGTSGTQTLAINSQRFDLRVSGSVLPNGVLQLTNPGMQMWVLSGGTVGNLVNSGLINVGTPGGSAGDRNLRCILDNQGTVTLHDGANLSLRYDTTNSGTINVTGGNLTSLANNVTNTGTVAIAPGRSYSHDQGSLNLTAGTFGGVGASMTLSSLTLNLTADFHTADWAGLSISTCTLNGPGPFINDAPGGFNPTSVTFNIPVDNQTTLSTNGGLYAGGFLNGVGSTLRLIGPTAHFRSGFTNAGAIELTAAGTTFWILSAANEIGTLVNTGQIDIGTPGGSAGTRNLRCILDNQGTVTLHDGANLSLRYDTTNSGTINVTGGNLTSLANNVTNTGTVAIAPGRSYSHDVGWLNLTAGTFGGVGASMTLSSLTLNLTADFHTADWAGLSISTCTLNGPGPFINDAPGGFNPNSVTFNIPVDNQTTLSTTRGAFNAGLLNPAGSLLRILGDNNSTVTPIAGGFTNDGTVHIISRGATLNVTGGPLVNNGLIEARREGSPQGNRHISFSQFNNHGTLTNFDVEYVLLVPNGPGATGTLANSGTVNVIGGNMGNWTGINFGNNLTFTNTGTVAIAAGRTYRQQSGTINLTAGTFGGPGSHLDVDSLTVSHTADFHTGDWASIRCYGTTFGGPGKFVNDHPVGFLADSPSGYVSTFNTFVENKSLFTSRGCLFTGGFSNPLGATLRIGSPAGFSQVTTRFLSGFTNHGVIEIVDWNATLATIAPLPAGTMQTLTNSPTGQIFIRRLGTTQNAGSGGLRKLKSHILNYGTLTVHDTDLQVGEGNYSMLINNYGTFNLDGGNLVFGNGPLNQATFQNFGVFNIGAGRYVNNAPDYNGGNIPPLYFTNKPGAILSGSGTIYDGHNASGSITINGVIRPGGENAIGTLNLAGTVTIPGDPAQIGAIVELDIGAPGAQANDQLLAGLVVIPDQGGRYLSVNVLGSNVPPPGDAIPLDNVSPYLASNLTVFDGGICVGCLGGGGPGTACGGNATVLAACPGPTITQQPQSIAPCPGDTISLSVVATGADPLTYQWQRITTGVDNLTNGPTGNGSTLSGADGPTLTISGLAAADLGSYAVVVSDANGSRISTLATLIGGCVINVTAATPQPFLDSLITPAATIVMQNVPDRPTLILPALTSLGGAMHVIGNGGLTNLQAALLATIGGGLDIRNNPLLTDVTLPALTTVTGDLDVSGNTAATTIDFGALGGVGGSVDVSNNPLLGGIDFGALGGVGGSVDVSNNPLLGGLDFGALGSVGGSVDVSNNPLLGGIDFGALGGVGGSVDVSNNPLLGGLDIGFVQTVVGSVSIRNNLALAAISMPLLTDVDGTIDINANGGLTDISLPSLTDVGGSIDINANGGLTDVSLPSVTEVGGSIDINANGGLTDVSLPSLTGVGGSIDINANGGLTDVSLPSLTNVGEDLAVNNNPAATALGLGSLQTVVGSVSIRNNLALAAISMPLLTDVDGGVEVSGNTSATTIDFGALGILGGDMTITNNPAAAVLDFASLGSLGGDMTITNNPVVTTIDFAALGALGGDMTITNNPAASTIDLGSLGSANGSVNVTSNPGASTIDLGSLGSANGSVNVTNNPGASTIDLGSLGSANGSVNVTNNPSATVISLGSLTDVGGNLTLETQGQADVDLSAVDVAGSTDISSTGATSVEVQTPVGTTSVEMCNDAACMDADLPDNAAPDGTPFAILHVDPQTLGRVPGLDETGQPAGVDPVAAYAFTLGAPLQGPASLVFDLTLAGLSPEEQAAVLDAYSDGRLTLTVQGDNPGDAPQARAQCGPADPLVADGCVKVGAFDALGFQLPPGVTAGAVTIRIAALVSHFSTYAVSIVTGRGDMNCDGEIDLADVEPFVQALTDPAGYTAAHPACPALGADTNQDGAANGLDVQSFVNMVVVP